MAWKDEALRHSVEVGTCQGAVACIVALEEEDGQR